MTPRRNIELKARCADLAAARERALALGAREAGVMQQVDTYFHAAHGRLKLREIDGERAELIWYERADAEGSRPCDYLLVPVPEPALLRQALTAALSARLTVRKRRELLLWHNVRIHLDQVDSLGAFVEFEAVLGEGDDEPTAYARLAELCAAIGLTKRDHQSVSYADLLASRAPDEPS